MTAVGVSFGIYAISVLIYKKTNPVIAVAFAMFATNGVVGLFLHENDTAAIVAGQSALYLVAVCLIAYTFNGRKLGNMLGHLAVLDAAVVLTKFCMGRTPYFIFDNPAFDSAFIACLLPGLMYNCKTKVTSFVIMAMVAACLVTQTSTGVLGVGIAIGSYFLAYEKFSMWAWAQSLCAAAVAAAAGFLIQGPVLFSGSGRFNVWELGLKNMWANHPLVGMGAGAWNVRMPQIILDQAVAMGSPSAVIFPWADNDWVQTAYDSGLIGLSLVVAVFLLTLWYARKRPSVFASLATFGAVAITEKPCRFFIFSLFGAYLVVRAFRKSKKVRSYVTLSLKKEDMGKLIPELERLTDACLKEMRRKHDEVANGHA